MGFGHFLMTFVFFKCYPGCVNATAPLLFYSMPTFSSPKVCQVLKEKLGVNCLVGLTATATRRTAVTVAKHLGIGAKDAKHAVLFTSAVPENLVLSVSRVT